MPRRKPNEDDLRAREKLATDMKDFRKNNLFTQKKLAEVLQISRRTVQMVESGTIGPHRETLDAWNNLTEKYRRNKR